MSRTRLNVFRLNKKPVISLVAVVVVPSRFSSRPIGQVFVALLGGERRSSALQILRYRAVINTVRQIDVIARCVMIDAAARELARTSDRETLSTMSKALMTLSLLGHVHQGVVFVFPVSWGTLHRWRLTGVSHVLRPFSGCFVRVTPPSVF